MVKCSTKLRLLAASVTTVLLLANAPSVQATALQDAGPSFRVEQNNGYNGDNGNDGNNGDNGKKRKKGKKGEKGGDYHQVPEGSAGAMLILAAGALGGGVLVWRRKRRALVA